MLHCAMARKSNLILLRIDSTKLLPHFMPARHVTPLQQNYEQAATRVAQCNNSVFALDSGFTRDSGFTDSGFTDSGFTDSGRR